MRKHFGWPGFGLYGDGLFRWNRTIGNSQYIIATGLFQEIKGWEIDLGYKHLQTLEGSDIIYPVDPATNEEGYSIIYPRDPRENYDAIEFGFSYTTSKRQWRYGFHLTSVLDGNNTDSKLWLGGSIDIPFGGSANPDPRRMQLYYVESPIPRCANARPSAGPWLRALRCVPVLAAVLLAILPNTPAPAAVVPPPDKLLPVRHSGIVEAGDVLFGEM